MSRRRISKRTIEDIEWMLEQEEAKLAVVKVQYETAQHDYALAVRADELFGDEEERDYVVMENLHRQLVERLDEANSDIEAIEFAMAHYKLPAKARTVQISGGVL